MHARPGKIAIFEQFAADGMTTMFGNPGTVEQGFLDIVDQLPAFDYVLALQETVAVGIADGYCRAAAAPALVQLHTGVGLGNGIGMLYQAKRGHSPLVVIAGSSGVRYDAMDSQMAADLVAMARPVTKYATRVTDPSSVLRVLRRAVKIAMTPPRGPVFVELPMDVLDAPTTEPAIPANIPSRATLPPHSELDRAAELLLGAQRPVILIGDGVAVSEAQNELTEVAERLGAPVWGVDTSEVNMDTTNPLYRGETGHMFGEVSAKAVADADAVLIVGTYVFPDVFPLLDNPFGDAKVVHIDLDEYEIGKNHPVDLGLVADPRMTLAGLAARLPDRRGERTGWRRPPVDQGDPLIEQFAAALADRVTGELVVFDEALTASPGLRRHLPPRVPGSYFATRGGSLGVGIPGAIGTKLARPAAEVVGFTGDGGSMYTVQALWTAARYGVAAKFVICDNGRYRLLDNNIEQYWRERDIQPHAYPGSFDLTTPPIGFVALAESMGVRGVKVEKAADVEQAVADMLDHDGPFLVHLITS
ncbi:thiamine pyrophosphate-binding protein [Actinophytocola algeriensis]|uniref:Benzoylformate decarboxylase n=1 Tax=Actinophytocola algeriensis TaxID=1768010 RepID=A0A7W7Q7A2_9PSEU|nr:thiamine pyrophosphate-binding protein [Actinophytocola algeriensis]MBB4908402.1 benzoylformate decarboxylase [Actinophytocola algeriensis]MBE1475211.1 benzoylformate decarboxylase [Actinophytocola algeriensis]